MGLYSRNKGKRGERLWASFCREQGYDVHRTAQYRGNTGAAGDVEGLPLVHCEVKFVQNLNIRKAMEQSQHDALLEWKRMQEEAPEGISVMNTFPIVASKRSGEPWLVTMYAWNFMRLAAVAEDGTLGRLHVLHKASQRFSVRKCLREAKESYKDAAALVAIKYLRGYSASLVTMYADDWFTLYREWEAGMDLKRRAEREEH